LHSFGKPTPRRVQNVGFPVREVDGLDSIKKALQELELGV
jgi:hypothetical protein